MSNAPSTSRLTRPCQVPKVGDARAIARAHRLDKCVIFFQRGDEVGYASYGETKGLCGEARRWADQVFDQAVQTGMDGGNEASR
jgi:hypothetical protein